MRDRHYRAIGVAGLLVLNGAVDARAMTDPTRPPHAVVVVEGEPQQAKGPVLQSVMIMPNRRSAIIDGERVEAGGRFGDAHVLKITETEVVLKYGDRTETLKMYPDVEKKMVRSADPVRRTPAVRGRQ
jgi:MSHA biogenesis protein MshK